MAGTGSRSASSGSQMRAASRQPSASSIHTVGIVQADETRVRKVHSKLTGWVDKLFVDFTLSKEGQEVVVKDGYIPLPEKIDQEELGKL